MAKKNFKNYWRLLTLNIHWRIKGGGVPRGPCPLLIKLIKV